MQISQGGCNYLGQGGDVKRAEFHCSYAWLLGMRPQHLLLYDKRMVIRLGDGL
jgi:hypothetical protein